MHQEGLSCSSPVVLLVLATALLQLLLLWKLRPCWRLHFPSEVMPQFRP